MQLTFDGRTVRTKACSSCGEAFEHVTGYLNDQNGAYVVYFAAA
jgi:hypothetical protein